jgi:hypothetical protein
MMDEEATVREYVARINAHDTRGLVALCTVDHMLAKWQVYADNKPVYEILSRSA